MIGVVSRGVYVAGGHGITTGKQSEALAGFDPLRRTGD